MQQDQIITELKSLPLGEIRYFEQIGSTNETAATWAEQGAPNFSLVIADEQRSGRGRQGRQWFTFPHAALAFSLIIRPDPGTTPDIIPRYTGLGALAVSQTLRRQLDLPAQIKWPNDVLIGNKKLCGILAETHWNADRPEAIILGIGVNVLRAAIPLGQPLNYPATSVESELGRPVDRLDLLREILVETITWAPRLKTLEFIQAWEASLAFRGEWIRINTGDQSTLQGQVLGLTPQGALRISKPDGQEISLMTGEVHPPDGLFNDASG